MAKDTVNLYAESDRGIISDDTGSALNLENSGTGSALKATNTGATSGVAIEAQVAATAAPTIAVIRATNSVASGNFFEFRGFLASIVSASSLARGVRVKFGDGANDYGFIPIYKGGVLV